MKAIISVLAFAISTVMIPVTSMAEKSPLNKASPMSMMAVGDTAIIGNGVIQLGINDHGALNVPGETSSGGTSVVGLRYLPTGAEATGPGCECEGWGVADPASGISGYANISKGIDGIVVESFEHDATTATSVVNVQETFRVTHFYSPSINPNLYQVNVSIENISPNTINQVLYRRVMDWDVEPTAFSEYVTIKAAGASDIYFTSDDGFASADPLAGPSSINFTGDAVDDGPSDHGALFDFDFGSLDPGMTKRFTTYYGAAAGELEALESLSEVGAEAYSLGQPSVNAFSPTLGSPNTFIFAFGEVSGTPLTLRTYQGLTNVDDFTGDGVDEIAVLSTTKAGYIQIIVKNPITNQILKTFAILNANWKAVDITSDGRAVNVLAFNKLTGQVYVQSKVAETGLQAYSRALITLPAVQ